MAPSRCETTSVVRFSALILLTPRTTPPPVPTKETRNLKFLYGSRRRVPCGNWAMWAAPDREWSRVRFREIGPASGRPRRSVRGADDLGQLDHHELGRLQRGESD